MPSSSNSTRSDSPSADSDVTVPPSSLPSQPPPQASLRGDDFHNTELGPLSQTPVTSRGLPLTTEQYRQLRLTLRTPHQLVWVQPTSFSIGYEALVITAAAIVAIQVQLLTSGSMATTITTHALLSFSMIFELLSIILAIRYHQYPQDIHISRPLPTLVHLASVAPTVLVLMGIAGLAAALVMDMLKTSLITAIAMSSVLIVGIIFCVLTLHVGRSSR